jgi:hypothetical protein
MTHQASSTKPGLHMEQHFTEKSNKVKSTSGKKKFVLKNPHGIETVNCPESMII